MAGWEDIPSETQKKTGWDAIPEEPTTIQRSVPQRIAGAVAPYARPALEFGGMAGGGALGAGAGPVGAVAGAGLGYAGGRQAANILEEYAGLRKPPTGPINALAGAAIDIPTGAAMEAGGQLGTLGLQKGAEVLAPRAEKLAERIYGGVVKTPLSKKWVKELPGEEISRRTRAIQEGISSEIPRSELGLAKLKKVEEETRGLIDTIVNEGAAKGDKVNFDEWIKSGLQRAEAIASKSSDPQGARATIRDIAKKFEAHLPEEKSIEYTMGKPQPPREIDTKKLNEIKRQLYDEVSWSGSEKTGLTAQLTESSKKGLAHDAMIKLEELYPQLDRLNERDGALIDLREAIERSVGRYDNRDLVGLGTKVLIRKATWPVAIWDFVVGQPEIKAKLAFALSKVGRFSGLPTTTKAISYGVLRPGERRIEPTQGD
jgi:hypothetical protein